jgi:hypothetical protein
MIYSFHSPADKVTYDIRMTHQDLIAVLFLRYISSVEILPKRSFNPSTILKKLLKKCTKYT